MPASTIKLSECFSASWCVGERQTNNCVIHSVRWPWFSLPSLVWWGEDTFSLNERQTGLFCKLVGALWPWFLLHWCWLLMSHLFACLEILSTWKSSDRTDNFCTWAVGSHWDIDISSLLLFSHYLPVCTFATPQNVIVFPNSAWLEPMPKSHCWYQEGEWKMKFKDILELNAFSVSCVLWLGKSFTRGSVESGKKFL